MIPEEYTDCGEEYIQLIMDAVYPYWRDPKFATSFKTFDDFCDWVDRKFDEAMEAIAQDELEPPTYN